MVGNKSKSIKYLDKALKLAHDNSSIMFRAGTTYEKLGNRKKAIYWIVNAIKHGYSKSEIESQPGLKDLFNDSLYKKEISELNSQK